jgi:serine/threonine protein phosphatase PrpC
MVTFARSVIGANHLKSGKPCQDSTLCFKRKDYTFLSIADGHGGDRYFRSDIGSRFATEAAKGCVTDRTVINAFKKPLSEKDRERSVLQLKKSIVSRWNTLVAEHIAANPFTESEFSGIPEKYADIYRAGEQIESAYGSTLIAVLQAKTFLLVLQIGDGNCVIVDRSGIFSHPVPTDERCFLNTTTSLCDKDAIIEFRHFFSNTLPAAVLIGSDGIDDCFGGDEKLYGFYRVILTSFSEKNEKTAAAELSDYLPRMSEKGSGDDMSVAMIADIPMVRTLDIGAVKPEPEISEPQEEKGDEDGSECHIGEMQ